jgi:hypothetical protein
MDIRNQIEGQPRGWEMSAAGGDWPCDRGPRTYPPGFEEYIAARARYFERLRIDSEIRRLERAWALPWQEGPEEAVREPSPDV